jgi:hypothetical protein
MKKLILITALLMFRNFVFSQNSNMIKEFLAERNDEFNRNVKMQVVNNLDSVIKSCQKRKTSYSHRTYMISIDSNNTWEINFAYSQTIINTKKIPFLMYKYSMIFNTINIEVVSGSDAL